MLLVRANSDEPSRNEVLYSIDQFDQPSRVVLLLRRRIFDRPDLPLQSHRMKEVPDRMWYKPKLLWGIQDIVNSRTVADLIVFRVN